MFVGFIVFVVFVGFIVFVVFVGFVVFVDTFSHLNFRHLGSSRQ